MLPLLGLVFALLAATSSLAASGQRPGPNVVFIVADDLRPDALRHAGNTQVRTPNLDRLAARGAVFTRVTCGYPICHVSRSEMFSGRVMMAAATGAPLRFDPSWTLWPEQMKRHGWRTVYSGKWHVAGSPAAAGFEATAGLFSSGPRGGVLTLPRTPTGRTVTGYTGWTFKDAGQKPLPELGVGLTPETDAIIAEKAIDAIREGGARPFFLQVNFTAPHDPLHWPPGATRDHRDLPLPANFRPEHPFETGNLAGRDERIVPAPRSADDVKQERAIYFELVENIDRQVGRIVNALEEAGVLENTLIVFTSDHGLALGSHGLMGKQNQYEHTINVPLILAGPGVPSGRNFAAQCYLRDLYPTMCELTGVRVPASVQGKSLVPVLRGETREVRDAIFGYFTDTQRMVRDADGWKLIWYPKLAKYQLFNVGDDPDELRDLATEAGQRERIEALKARLAEWQRQHGDPVAAVGS